MNLPATARRLVLWLCVAVLFAAPVRATSFNDAIKQLKDAIENRNHNEQTHALDEMMDGEAGSVLLGGGTSIDNAPVVNIWINRISLELALAIADGDDARVEQLRRVLDALRGRKPPAANGTNPPPPPREDPLPAWTQGDLACFRHCSPLWDEYQKLKDQFLDAVHEVVRLTVGVSVAEDWLRLCEARLRRANDRVDEISRRLAALEAAHDVSAEQARRDLDVARQSVRAEEYNLRRAREALDAARQERDAKLSAAEKERDRLRQAYGDALQAFLRCLKKCIQANEQMGRDCDQVRDFFLDQIRFFEGDDTWRAAREFLD